MFAPLNHHAIHAWTINTDKSTQKLTCDFDLLSVQEKLKAKRFKNNVHGNQWAYIHVCMRQILSHYFKQNPSALRFSLGSNGKPYIAQNSSPFLNFNLSHSGERALLALTYNGDVGVDIEVTRELDDYQGIMTRFFSLKEQEFFSLLSKSKHQQAFYHGWTRKEAIIKAIGLGFSAPLKDFDVNLASMNHWQLIKFHASLSNIEQHAIHHLDLESNYVGAIALKTGQLNINTLPKIDTFNYDDL